MLSNRYAMLGALVILPTLAQVSSTLVSPEGHRVHRHGPIRIISRSADGTNATSSNWSGYVVTTGGVTKVTGSWIVPTMKCSTSGYSSFWVGIDGDGSSTVEQTGTEMDCSGGRARYSAWYEFYPNPPVTVFSTSPGAHVTASVTYSGGKFTTHVSDNKGHSNTHTGTVGGARLHSAEWIAEAPASAGGVLPLADFGTGYFGADHTGVSGTCGATISGRTSNIGAFSHTSITMNNPHGQSATPSGLSSDGTSFSVLWK